MRASTAVLVITVTGALIYAAPGLVLWAMAAVVAAVLFRYGFNWVSSVRWTKKIQNETATDFIASHPELIRTAYPAKTPHQARRQVAILLQSMMERAVMNNPYLNLGIALYPQVFFSSAIEVAEDQPTETTRNLVMELIDFIRQHRLWYSGTF
jgi:hypothetical protein